MSKSETIFQKIEEITLKLINQFLLFQYSWFNISVKKGICETILSALERVRMREYFVQVSKLELLQKRRKSPLNIQTIEISL